MLRKVNTATFVGVEGKMVVAEVNIGRGMPGLRMVGLASRGVREAGLRMRAAMSASDFHFPNSKITINLAPASLKKDGSHFDLPCAVALIYAKDGLPQEELSDWVIFGELSLDGGVSPVAGLIPMLFAAVDAGFRKFIIPQGNESEASAITGVEIYKVANLKETLNTLSQDGEGRRVACNQETDITQEEVGDFADVKGQEACKRGLAIAVAGGHGVIMLGTPGIGKSMLARRLPSIMPKLEGIERLEVAAIHSVAGLLKEGEVPLSRRPFREPPPTITPVGMIGGGRHPKPGELSLAHGGVLFMDEVTSFPKGILELIISPLEDGYVKISRANTTVEFPAKPLVVMATNPCSCGWLGDERHRCTCTQNMIYAFWNKLSGPLLDRIDIHLMLNPPSYYEVSSDEKQLDSAQMRAWVDNAREMQRKRFSDSQSEKSQTLESLPAIAGTIQRFNADMNEVEVEEFCQLDDECRKFVSKNYDSSGMTARSYFKLLKIARTIADIEQSHRIRLPHILEAYQYNRLDEWKEGCIGV